MSSTLLISKFPFSSENIRIEIIFFLWEKRGMLTISGVAFMRTELKWCALCWLYLQLQEWVWTFMVAEWALIIRCKYLRDIQGAILRKSDILVQGTQALWKFGWSSRVLSEPVRWSHLRTELADGRVYPVPRSLPFAFTVALPFE